MSTVSSLDETSNPAAGRPAKGWRSSPLTWVPTGYLAMGTVYVLVTLASTVMYKNLGRSNAEAAAFGSLLGLPYTVKFLWAPSLELRRTKRFFVVATQVALAVLVALAAFGLVLSSFVAVTFALFMLAALLGATQDIATDGVYVTSLNREGQAKFTGVQSLCWSIGPILVTGLFIRWTGMLHEGQGWSYAQAWQAVLGVIAVMLLVLAGYHRVLMPPGAPSDEAQAGFLDAFRSLLRKPEVGMMLAFAFLYRLSQGLLDKIGPLFMIEAREAGGLGLSQALFGDINGTYGTIGFLVGSLLGGFLVARRGLQPTLFGLCLAINVPNATYIWLSLAQPSSVGVITTVVVLEKLFFGIGAVGHMIYLMQQLAPGRYQTAHYAFGTGLMGLCMTATGLVSGVLQEWMGYRGYFVFVMVATIPSFIVTMRAPFVHGAEAAR